MPIFILVAFTLVALMGTYYYFFLRRMGEAWGWKNDGWKARGLRILISLLLTLSILRMRSIVCLFVLHVFFLSMVCDLLHLPFRRFRKVQKLYLSGLIPVGLTVVALVFGYFHMQRVQPAYYTVETPGVELRIAFLSDLHYPNAMTAERLQSICDEIEATQPDLFLLGGDIIDEGTEDEEIRECISILDSLECTYGSYFICGNHDNLFRGLSSASVLIEALENSRIRLLADEAVQIEGLTLIGRKDLTDGSRKALSNLIPERAEYVLSVDHQPLDAELAAEQGADLMLSGHTHNGQIWPIGFINALLGPKYGHYRFGDMDLIVSSGVVGWAYPIRTQGQCEYVILDLKNTK